MKISRNNLAFMSMLTAGLLLAGATVLMPSAKTFGQETDAERILAEAEKAYAEQQNQAPASSAPAPPAAPVENPAPSVESPAASVDNAGAAGGAIEAAGLPSAGNGGYLNRPEHASLGYLLLVTLGVTVVGPGALVWAFSRRDR